jgi:hypothetical protein
VRERKRKRGRLPLQRERKMRIFEIHKVSPLYLESLNTDPSDLFTSDVSGASEWQGTCLSSHPFF